MAVSKPLVVNRTISAIDVITQVYESPSSGQGTILQAITASNDSLSSVSYKAYIYDGSGDVVAAIVPLKIVVRDKFDSAPSAVNQVIPAGGTLRIENSAADGLNYYVSGVEQ